MENTQIKNFIESSRKAGIPDDKILAYIKSKGVDVSTGQPTEQPVENKNIFERDNILKQFSTGVGKGVLSTIKGAGQLGEKIGGAILPESLIPTPESVYSDEATKGTLLDKENLKAKGTAEKIGKGTEQIAEFFTPSGVIGKAKMAVEASKLGKVAQTASKALLGATELGGVSAIQSGGEKQETGISAGIGAISPILGAGIKSLKPVVAPLLEFTSGVPKKAIQKAMTGDEAVKLGMNMTTEQVRNKAVSAYKTIDTELKDSFKKGIEELSKLSPRLKQARTKPVGGTSVFSGVKGEFKNLIEKSKTNIPQAFRELRISASKNGKLDFDKLNSSIVNASERKQIQQVWDTIRNQKDFSIKGVQDVASRINALSKYQKGLENVSSVAIGKMHDVYSKAIEKVYPELGKLRSNYKTSKEILNTINDVVKSNAKTPTQIQTAISKLTNLYKEDKDTYLRVIDDLSKKSGVDISGLLAGTEFSKIMPDFIRGIGGGATLATSATFLNPLMLLLFPLFSPKMVGKAITLAPQIGKVLEPAKKIITGAIGQIER